MDAVPSEVTEEHLRTVLKLGGYDIRGGNARTMLVMVTGIAKLPRYGVGYQVCVLIPGATMQEDSVLNLEVPHCPTVAVWPGQKVSYKGKLH